MRPGTRTLSEIAEEALSLAQAEPARAAALAATVLDDEAPPVDRVRALWALGLARRELDDLDGSASAFRTAINEAHRQEEVALAAEVTSSLAWAMARMGRLDEALRLTEEAAEHLPADAAARNEMQRGLVLHRLGRNQEALASFDAALAGLEAAGDLVTAARLRLNRSVIHVYSGALDEAVNDLETAYHLAVDQGQVLLEAACAHNLGFTHGRRGDIPSALTWFEVAQAIYTELGGRHREAILRSDRAEVYAEAGLMREALSDVAEAVEDLRREDEPPVLADALLLLARIADLAGDEARAVTAAAEARQLFAEQGRDTWELRARYLETISALRNSGDARHLVDAQHLASRLEDERWESEARRARVEAARLAFDNGDHHSTVRILEPLEGTPGASPIDRVVHAEAMYMLNISQGREGEAHGSVRRGLTLLDRHRAAMGSPEIRAGFARHGVRLVAAAVDRALAGGDPWQVLQAVDTWRARSMDFPPALPPDDAELAGALAELRQVESDLRQEQAAGGDTSDLSSRRRRVEARIGRMTRRVAGDGRADGARLRRDEVVAALEGRALVAYFSRLGTLHSVCFDGSSWRLMELGPIGDVADSVAAAVFALSRLASAHASEASLAAAAASLDDVTSSLSETLLEATAPSDLPLVVVPTGALHRLPWSALSALSGRAFSVAPSLRGWMRASRPGFRLHPTAPVTLVAGPGLSGAREEVERLARLYPGGRRLTGRNARVDRVLAVLDGAAVAHLAAHGTFRSDNPLFSSLRMADGPLTVYDLERLDAVPPIVVMPSCDSAVSDVGVGDELLGVAAALLRIGVSSLIAPTVPIPDLATKPLMVGFHRRLMSGEEPAQALASAMAAGADDSPQERAARAAFVLLGA